jgi:dihydroorotase
MTSYLISGAELPSGGRADVAIRDGLFVDPKDVAGKKGTVAMDASGLVALPGLVDLHTHLRQPGLEQAETILSGSQSAALGGFTAVHAMANTDPVADTPGITDVVARMGREAGYVTVRPVGAITKGLAGEELSAMAAMATGSGAVRVFSDDGKCVHDSLVMRRALEQAKALGAVVAQHAQDPRLTVDSQMNEGALSSRLGLTGWPGVAEESIIARDVLLAEYVGARLHVCHLSTAGSVDVIRWAKKRGIAVTAEVTPHHLLLTEDLVAGFDPLFKVNPPLRTMEDTIALREALAEGIIDIVATDHAPHPSESKECAFGEAAFGMLGLEMALPVVIETLVKPGLMAWSDVARVFSSAPATIGSLAGYDAPLTIGSQAHLTLVDPSVMSLGPRGSLSSNNPYPENALPGRVMFTFHHGVATVAGGELVDAHLVSLEGRR